MTPEVAAGLRQLGAEPEEIVCKRQGVDPIADLRYAAMVQKRLKQLKPDVFLGYTSKPVVWGAPAARAAGVPKIGALITGLGYAFTGGSEVKRQVVRQVLGFLYRRALRICDVTIFQNPDDKADFQRMGLTSGSSAVHVVNGSGIDLASFPPMRTPEGASFLLIARLLKDKGVREYAAAAMALKQRYPHVPFRLAGWIDPSPDSIMAEDLEAWRAGGIEFLGRLEDVRPALAACACYVLPSYREGTPRSVLEAMATGRAVITTDAPGCRETVTDGVNGWRVQPRDTASLEAAMEQAIASPERLAIMGEQSRRLAEAKYDVHAVNRAMMAALGLRVAEVDARSCAA